jgi:hypothetical protein
MKCYVRSAKIKILFLAYFILFILDSAGIVSKLELRKESDKMKLEMYKKLENYVKSNVTDYEPNKIINTTNTEEEKSNIWEPMKKNYALLVGLITISLGFLIASLFLIIALLYNKETMSQISSASIEIVKSLNEIHKGKFNSGDVLTMHI